MKTYSELINSCYRLLSVRPRSRQEVVSRLQKYTSDTSLINQIVEDLTTQKLLNDREFASWLIESRSRSRPRGRRLLQFELQSKGIDIDEESIPVNEKELARKALEKKQIAWLKLSAREFRRKATRYLYARGFSWETIEPVIKMAYNNRHVS